MSRPQDLEALTNREYAYGWSTEIESDTAVRASAQAAGC